MDQKYFNNQKQLEIRQRKGRGERMRKNHNPLVKAAIWWLIKFVGRCRFAFYLATSKSYTTGLPKPKFVKLAIEWSYGDSPHVSLDSEAVGNSSTAVAKETETSRQVVEETKKPTHAANETKRSTSVVEKAEKSAPVIEKITATEQLLQKCKNFARLEDMNLSIEETRKTSPSDSSHRGDPDEERKKVSTSFSAANTAPGKKKDRSSGYISDHSSSLLEWKQDDPKSSLHQQQQQQQQPHVPGQEPQHNHSNAILLSLKLPDTGQSSRESGAGKGQPQQLTQPSGQVQTPASPKDASQPAKMLTQHSKEKPATVVPPTLVTEQCHYSYFEIPPGAPDSLPSHSPYSYTTSPLYQHSLSSSGDDPPGIPQEEQQQWQQLWEKQQWEQWYYDQWRQQQQQQWEKQAVPPVVAQAVDESNREICFSEEESGTSGTQGPGW